MDSEKILKQKYWEASVVETEDGLCPSCGCNIWDVVYVARFGIFVCENCIKPEDYQGECCQNCNNDGIMVYSYSDYGEAGDIGPCQWCYETPNSIFNLNNEDN